MQLWVSTPGFCRFGEVESIRFRSVPLKLDEKIIPRRAAILAQKISSDRGSAHAYIVFKATDSAAKALELNMTEVNGHCDRSMPASHPMLCLIKV